MATWKKVIVSGSSADLLNVSASAGFKGNLAGTATNVGNSLTVDDSTIQLNSGTTYDGAAARTISVKNSGITLAKIANITENTILGNVSGGDAAPSALTAANVRTLLNVEDGADVTDAAGIRALGVGIVSSSAQVSSLAGTNDSTITITAGDGLQGGGSFTTNTGSAANITLNIDVDVIAGSGISADNTNEELDVNVDDSTIEVNGSNQVAIKDSGVGLAKLANIGNNTILGNIAGSEAAPSALTKANVLELINVEDGANAFSLTAAGIRGVGAGIVSSSAQVDISGKTVAASQVTEISNLTAAEGAQLENIGATTISATQWGYLGGMDQNVKTTSNPTFNNLRVSGDLTVEGSRTELQVANLNVEDQYILLNSGSTSGDSGIIFGGSNTTANSGHALILDNSYNSNDGRLAVQVTDKAASNADDFEAGTTGYYLAGVYEGSAANAATALADHPGNIRIESSEIYIYV